MTRSAVVVPLSARFGVTHGLSRLRMREAKLAGQARCTRHLFSRAKAVPPRCAGARDVRAMAALMRTQIVPNVTCEHHKG